MIFSSADSLMAEAFDGILKGRFQGMIHDGENRDHDGSDKGQDKIMHGDIDSVRIILQNPFHDKKDDWPGNDISDGYQKNEFS